MPAPSPALMKYTFSFRDGKPGWTESWYAPSIVTQAAAEAAIFAYLKVRMPLNGTGIWADFAKASKLDGSGVAYKTYPNLYTTSTGVIPKDIGGTPLIGAQGVTPAYVGPSDRAYSTLMFTFLGDRGAKNIFLSGVPDNVITDPYGPTFLGNYATATNKWAQQVATNGWGWNSRKSANNYPKTPIIAVTANTTPPSIIAPNSTVQGGDFVQLGGFKGLKGYRGQFFVIQNNSGVITLQGYTPPATLNKPKGYIQLVGVGFVAAPGSWDTVVETHHNRGGGIGLPVGRRKARSN